MPDLRARVTSLRAQVDTLAGQLVDRDTYLKLAENLESFLTRLQDTASAAAVPERQRVLRLLVKEILVGPERITIRHCIPATTPDPTPGYLLRGRSHGTALVRRRDDRGRQAVRRVNGHLHLPALRLALDAHVAAQAVGTVRHDEPVIAA